MSATSPETATEIIDPKEFDDATRRALADFILALADTKRFLGLRYAEWSDGAPALEASVAASAMAQDELGHSRALLPMLRDFPEVDPSIPEEAPRRKYSSIAFLDSEFKTWPTFVAANALVGTALTEALEAARSSRYVPLRTRAVKILEEERFHWMHGESWFKRIANDAKEGLELSFQVEEILPQALCWFGQVGIADPAIAGGNDPLVREEILDANADELRSRYLTRVGPLLSKSQAAHLIKIEGGRWQFAHGLPWMKYDPVTRRVG
jgi:ring-1,2-phenylacetyl-CoA epoxidase subunit PaaC